ncbi:hypothetical protein [Tuwongella immobilis]|uniref:Lipoprotein n=1 Tax=Tuwongella immobilis TaxID=692036 RepID=A0A6C2YKM0_9BACT|nr:hypothetical protein [Tuwongella immobilis]VIP01779.1 unnamed protein product [Tuwongella immobilis]VTR99424.1 unnamed protein product [Tuwongella immobilis]
MRRRWYIVGILTALLIAAGLGIGCLATASRAVEIAQLRGPYRVQVYQDGHPVRESTFAPGSAEERAIADWLAAHPDGWQRSLVTYVPGRMVRGDGFSLNLLPNGLCVLNDDLSAHPQQLVRQLPAADVEALVAATGGE